MNPITYDQAVDLLSTYIEKKTTHNTKDIIKYMDFLYNMSAFVNAQDRTDFGTICSIFAQYAKETERTSIGRKQFEEWWGIQFTGEASDFSVEAMNEVHGIVADPLPEELDYIANDAEETEQLKYEITRLKKEIKELTYNHMPRSFNLRMEQLEERNERLSTENCELRDKLKQIAGIISPWS